MMLTTPTQISHASRSILLSKVIYSHHLIHQPLPTIANTNYHFIAKSNTAHLPFKSNVLSLTCVYRHLVHIVSIIIAKSTWLLECNHKSTHAQYVYVVSLRKFPPSLSLNLS